MVLVGGCFWSRWPLLAIGRVGLGECSCDMPHAQLRHAGIFWLSSRANVSLVTAQTFDLILNLCVILRTAMIQQLEAHKIAEFGWRGFDDRGSVSANQLGGKARCLSQPARDRPIGSGTSLVCPSDGSEGGRTGHCSMADPAGGCRPRDQWRWHPHQLPSSLQGWP